MADRVYPSQVYPSAPPHGSYYNVEDPNIGSQKFGGQRRQRRSRNCCCLCLAWFCSVLISLIVLIGLAVLIFWLVVRPKVPKYHVQDVELSGLNFNSANVSSDQLTLNVETKFTVQANNPNKKIGIYYDRINVQVESEGLNLGNSSLPSFYQGHRNISYIKGDMKSGDVSITSTLGSAFQTAAKAGNVPLYVSVDVKARIKVGSLKSPRFWVHVRCNVNVNPTSTGSQLLSNSCKLKR